MSLVREPLSLSLPDALRRVLDGDPLFARAFLVGGCVRDALLGIAPKDFDLEVYGADYVQLQRALARFGPTDLVGRAFGVVVLTLPDGSRVDFTLPRRDSRVGRGHRGFQVTPDPALDPAEAAARRDFTINALSFDPREAVVLDHHGGLADLRAGVLRHTSAAFTEDPLRVLRALHFVSRFSLRVAPETVQLCRSISDTYGELARERVWAEWHKWARQGVTPSLGLAFLRDCDWLRHFPELAAMVGTEQDEEWHPEGDVWTHTLHCADALARDAAWRSAGDDTRTAWMFAVLLHDCGKPATMSREPRAGRERIVSPGHESAGVPLAQAFLERIGAPHWVAQRVCPLVMQHMTYMQAGTPRAVRRVASRLQPETITGLAAVIRADVAGRPPLPAEPPQGYHDMLRVAAELELRDRAPRPLLLGRHLLDRGWEPGRTLGPVLEEAFEAQLDGAFHDLDGALAWLEKRPRG